MSTHIPLATPAKDLRLHPKRQSSQPWGWTCSQQLQEGSNMQQQWSEAQWIRPKEVPKIHYMCYSYMVYCISVYGPCISWHPFTSFPRSVGQVKRPRSSHLTTVRSSRSTVFSSSNDESSNDESSKNAKPRLRRAFRSCEVCSIVPLLNKVIKNVGHSSSCMAFAQVEVENGRMCLFILMFIRVSLETIWNHVKTYSVLFLQTSQLCFLPNPTPEQFVSWSQTRWQRKDPQLDMAYSAYR